jgi:hypothetical protein
MNVEPLGSGSSMVRFAAGAGEYCLLRNAQACSGANPDSYSVASRVVPCGVYRLGRDVDH